MSNNVKCFCGSMARVQEVSSQSGDVIRGGYARIVCPSCHRSTAYYQNSNPQWFKVVMEEWKEICDQAEADSKVPPRPNRTLVPVITRQVTYNDIVRSIDRYNGEVSEEIVNTSSGWEIVKEEWVLSTDNVVVTSAEPVTRSRVIRTVHR